MKWKGALFDMDGTLADSLADIAYAVNRALVEFGYPAHPIDAFRTFVGDGLALTVQRALPPEGKEAFDEISGPIRRYYERHLGERSTIFPGVAHLLDELTRREIALVIVSNKPDWALQDIVKQYFSRWTFAMVAGQSTGIPLKPDPTLALEAARTIGAPPAHCLFVGDSGVDMQTAANAGMFGVGVLWGYQPREELLKNGARILVEKPTDLLAVVDGRMPG